MSDNLLDTTDIFKIKSLGSSPLNEHIESQDKMVQVIADFDENIRQSTSQITCDTRLYNDTSHLHHQVQESVFNSMETEDIQVIDYSSQNSSQISTCEVSVSQSGSAIRNLPLQEIQIQNNVNIIEHSFQQKVSQQQNEKSFSVKDDVLGGMQLSYVDFSKKIFQQYRQQSQQQQQQPQIDQLNQNLPTTTTNNPAQQTCQSTIVEEEQMPQQNEKSQEIEKKACLDQGIDKIKELGDTIKMSINTMHQKFNEVKVCVSQLVEEDKYKDMWDQKLNDFYNKLFNQASKALFTSATTGTPSKIITPRPQSVYRFNTKSSVSKPLSTINTQQTRKPGSVTKFNVPSMMSRPKSVIRENASKENNKPNSVSKPSQDIQNTRQKSFTVQKFNTSKTATTTTNNNNNNIHFGILKNSKDIKKDTPKTTPLQQNLQKAGKENQIFFKK